MLKSNHVRAPASSRPDAESAVSPTHTVSAHKPSEHSFVDDVLLFFKALFYRRRVEPFTPVSNLVACAAKRNSVWAKPGKADGWAKN